MHIQQKIYQRPEWLFVVIGSILGMAFVFTTPPLKVPDEDRHLFRAFQIAEGKFLSEVHDDKAGGWIPRSLINCKYLMLRSPDGKRKQFTPGMILDELQVSLNSDDRIFAAFRSSAYSPLAYLPSAAVYFVVLPAEPSPLALLYLGRIVNLAFWLAMVYVAIRITPVHKWVLFLLALTPMSLYQAASLSADSMTNALAFLGIACFLHLSFGPVSRIKMIHLVILTLLTASLSLCKNSYLAICFLYWLIPSEKFANRKVYYAGFCVLAVLNILLMAAWFYATARFTMSWLSGVHPDVQLKYILAHPFHYFRAIVVTLDERAVYYYKSFIGYFGWCEIWLSRHHTRFWLLLLVSTAVLEGKRDVEIKFRHRAVMLLVTAFTCLLIFTLLYLCWNPVGNKSIIGIQGRYFIPIGPLVFLLFYNRRFGREYANAGMLLGTCTVVSLGVSLWTIANYYYL